MKANNEKTTENYKRSKTWQDRIDWVNEIKLTEKDEKLIRPKKRGSLLHKYF